MISKQAARRQRRRACSLDGACCARRVRHVEASQRRRDSKLVLAEQARAITRLPRAFRPSDEKHECDRADEQLAVEAGARCRRGRAIVPRGEPSPAEPRSALPGAGGCPGGKPPRGRGRWPASARRGLFNRWISGARRPFTAIQCELRSAGGCGQQLWGKTFRTDYNSQAHAPGFLKCHHGNCRRARRR